MPPYWALGFQLCRYGYNSLAKLKETVDRNRAYDIPLVSYHVYTPTLNNIERT